MAFTDYTQKKILGWLFNGESFTPPSFFMVGVSFTDPTSDKGFNEPSGGGYARVKIASGTTDITAPTPDTLNGGNFISNAQIVQFPDVTADWINGGYDTVQFWLLFDDQPTPNLIAYGKLSQGKKITQGDDVSFDPKTLQLTLK